MADDWSDWNTETTSALPEITAEEMAIVEEAKNCLKEGEDWEAQARTRFDYDYKFANGDTHNKYQWDSDLILKRELENKPILTINKVQQHNLLIINDSKQNKPGIRIRPVSDEASFEGAEVFQELIYHTEYISGAENIYDAATVWQVEAGIGYWQVDTDWLPDTFEQEIYIKQIKDPRSVFLDPNINEVDGSDARWGLIFEDIDKKLFKKKYPKYANVGTSYVLNNSSVDGWLTKDKIRVAIFYRKEEKEDKLVTFIDDQGIQQLGKYSDLTPEGKAWYKEHKKEPTSKERDIVTQNIKKYKLAGDRIIEQTDWLGKYIPIVRLPGVETVIDGILDRKGHTRALINAQQMYNYNCLDLNTILPTPTGWTTIKEVQIGDLLIDDKGQFTKVIGVSPININRKCFQINFDTGYNIVADENHLWTVEERGKRKAKTWDWNIKTITTKELISKKHFIKVVEPVELPDINLLINPYVLGIWLGDGGTNVNSITSSLEDMHEMQANIIACGYNAGNPRIYGNMSAGTITIHGLRNQLSSLGLLGNKHIPKIYLRASKQQRLELLQGLMDTDGCISKTNRQCIFVNTNTNLIAGITELLSSLGIKCTREIVSATIRKFPNGNNSECLEAYRISFTADPNQLVFKLNRKVKIQQKFKSIHWRRTKRHGIVSIIEIPSVPVKCLTVDAPSKLFLAGPSWIPTHNTSANIEYGALQTKSPYIAPSAAIEGYEEYYKTANSVNHSYMPYNHIDDDGNTIPAPQRQQSPQVGMAYVESLKIAQNEMMMASGQYQAQLGENENAKSGVAINARQRQGDRATYHFLDNQAIAIRFTGRICIDLYPKIYDTKRVKKILARDGTKKEITIDPDAQQSMQKLSNLNIEQEKSKQIEQIIFNPNVGMYDIQSDTGPSFATRRMEMANALTQIAANNKDFMNIGGDLYFKALDFPDADILSERYRRIIPPNVTGDGLSPQVEQVMHQASDKIEHLTALVQQQNEELKNKEAELALKDREMTLREKEVAVEQQRLDYEAETRRVTALGNSGPAISQEQIAPVVRQLLAGMLANGELIAGAPAPHEGGTPIQLPTEPTGDNLSSNGNASEGEEEVPMEGARKAADGKWYVEHPAGGYAEVIPQNGASS